VQSLLNVDNQEIGLENLEGMLKILPDSNEVFSLINQGDLDKLGEAEKFMHALIQVPK
jgi:hypothetical protein